MSVEAATLALKAFDAEVPHIVAETLENVRAKGRARQAKLRARNVTSRDKRDRPNEAKVTSGDVTSPPVTSPLVRVEDNLLDLVTQRKILSEANASSSHRDGARTTVALAKPNGFARFWEAYPAKVGKREAEKAYGRAIRRLGGPDPPAVILAGVQRATTSRKWREGFIKNPATWLNQDCWTDEEPDERPSHLQNGSPHNGRSRAESNFSGAAQALAERAAQRTGSG
jgi:hypothetical protein